MEYEWKPLIWDEDKCNCNLPIKLYGKWMLFTDGKNMSVECLKCDALDVFNPPGRWFNATDAIAYAEVELPKVPFEISEQSYELTEEERTKAFEKVFPIGSWYQTLKCTGSPEEKGLPGKWKYRGCNILADIWERVE